MDLNFEKKSFVAEDGQTVHYMEAVYVGYTDWYVGCFFGKDGSKGYFLSDSSWTAPAEVQEKSFCEGEWEESQLEELKAYILELDDKEREWQKGCKKA